MADVINLNLFGTTIKGLDKHEFKQVDLNCDDKITLSDVDLNRDGEVTQEELDYFKTYYGFDPDDLSIADTNKNGEISANEYTIAIVQSFIQETLDSYKSNILAMNAYSDEEKAAVADRLVSAAKNFYENYNGKISEMKAAFKTEIEALYKQIEAEYQDRVFRRKFDEAAELAFIQMQERLIKKGLDTPEKRQRFADKFFSLFVNDSGFREAANYLDVVDLAGSLIRKLDESDQSVLSDDIETAKKMGSIVGNVISDEDAQRLRCAIFKILKTAISKGIIITLNGTKITTEKAADSFLNTCNFYDINKYNKLIDDIKSQLSEEKLIDKLIRELFAEEKEEKVEDILESVQSFGAIEYSELDFNLDEFYQAVKDGDKDTAYGKEISPLRNQGKIRFLDGWYTSNARARQDLPPVAAEYLVDMTKEKYEQVVKAKCEELGIEYNDSIKKVFEEKLGEAALEAVNNNFNSSVEYYVIGWQGFIEIPLSETLHNMLDIFNEKFIPALENAVQQGDIVKDNDVAEVDTSSVNLTLKYNVTDPRNIKDKTSSYNNSDNEMSFNLQQLLSGTATSTILLAEFDANGRDFAADKDDAMKSINKLLDDIGSSLTGSYNSDKVKSAVETCKSYYKSLISQLESEDKNGYTYKSTVNVTYQRNGQTVTEAATYYSDSHRANSNRKTMENAADNTSGLQVYRDNSGQDDFFITVDLAKVVQNLFRFL